LTTATLEQAREVTARIAADPVWFAEHILGHDVWGVPRAILTALAQPRARVAVKSCHASSKTFSAAEAVLWTPYAGGIAITTAPTARQVRRLVWTEVNSMYPAARVPLGGELLQTEFRIAADLYALGLSTDAGVNFQGFHARPGGFMLVVLDEAPGVEPAVYAAIEGIRAGGDVRVLALGNPDVPSGPFYDAFSSHRSGWTTFTIDGFDTPNLEDEERPGRQLTLEELLTLPDHRLDVGPRPYLITRRYILEKYTEWGEQSPLWQSKVRGQFPDQSEDALLSLAWLEAAKRSAIQPQDTDPWEAGIDVAGPGEDETVAGVRHGPVVVAQRAWSQADPRGAVLDWLAPWKDRLSAIKVDSIGQGYYFARHLEDNGYRGRVVDVNVGESPSDKERYTNLKAELYWGLRLRAQSGELAGLADDLTLSQLSGIRYSHNARGQVVIESKETARKRGVKSPDRAEMWMLLFAEMQRRAGVMIV
jgi:phage terminase large subunit